MKIDKAIFGVDDSYFLEFWPIQAKLCREILNVEPVLFYICDEDSNFYNDGHGLVKKIKKTKEVTTGLLACIARMYGTKYFPEDVCLTCVLDMLMISKEYFQDQIKDYNEDSLVIYSSDAYDLNRPEAKSLFETEPFPFTQEMYNYPYNAAKGKIFNQILDTDCSFEEFVIRHSNYKPGYRYMWMIDEFYFADCVNNKKHDVEVHKLKRGYTTPWIANNRIERHNFPVELEWEGERQNQEKFGIYDVIKLKEGYYYDVNCCRPYSKYKDAIDDVIEIVLERYNLNKIKKVALISTFCNTEIKLDTLKQNILKVKDLGIDVMVISPIHLPKNITDLCDYYFQTKDNPLLEWPIRAYTHWYRKEHSPEKILYMHRGLADYGWAALYQVKKLSQIALSFDYDMFYHMIYDLEIDNVIEQEFLANKNIVHPRRNLKNPNEIWETNLHFVALNRELMEQIEKDITLDEYLRTNGVAETEVKKWVVKYNIPTSEHFIKDTIFYWDDFDFYDYKLFPEFKMFISKNTQAEIWVNKETICEQLGENLRIVFHGFEDTIGEVKIKINGIWYNETPNPFEYIEFPINSQEIDELIFEYNGKSVDYTKDYSYIMRNLVYYDYRL